MLLILKEENVKLSKLTTLFILFIAFLMTSCAVRTEVKRVSADEVRANLYYQNIIFNNFTAAPQVPNPGMALIDCKSTAMEFLKAQSVFKHVDDDPSRTFDEPTLYVNVELLDLRIVSSAARIWGGALAGRSHMLISAQLVDSNGETVAEKELKGAPNAYGSAWSFGGSDRGIAKNMGVLLGDYILGNVSGQ